MKKIEMLLNELKDFTGNNELYIDKGGNISVVYNSTEFLIHLTNGCENLFTILRDDEANDKNYLEYNEVLLEAKNIICGANRGCTEKFTLVMDQLFSLEKLRLSSNSCQDYTIRRCEAEIAGKFFTDRKEWTKILIENYGIEY